MLVFILSTTLNIYKKRLVEKMCELNVCELFKKILLPLKIKNNVDFCYLLAVFQSLNKQRETVKL